MNKIFENIITDFKTFIKTLPVSNESVLCSFAFHFDNSHWSSFINNTINNYSDIFFFKPANNQQTLIGINSAISLHSNEAKSFNSVSMNFNHWKNIFFNNWDTINKRTAQIIFCAAKFDANNSSSLWEDFNPLRIFIPEFIIEINANKAIGYFNFVRTDGTDGNSLSDKLFSYLNFLDSPYLQKTEVLTKINKVNFADDKNFSKWSDIFEKAFGYLNESEIKKIVLSRTICLKIKDRINWQIILDELNKRFPDCYLFLIKNNGSIFFGSSPELFLRISMSRITLLPSIPARGMQTESDKKMEKFLQTSVKNHKEHIIVSDFISSVLLKFSNNVHVIEEKQIRKLDNIQHLITRISAELNSDVNIFELIDELFPTPAVCGIPKDKVMQIIKELEHHDRGLYSGLVGIFDFEENCEIAVAIRSALVKENIVTAFAGAGIISDSAAKEEFLEIKLKLDTILSLFTDENKS